MKVIIAGGRYFIPERKHWNTLDKLHKEYSFTEIVSGKARGADSFGEEFAEMNKIPIKEFPAEWDNTNLKPCLIKVNPYGKPYNALAGFARNQRMAEYADAVIIFHGEKGTADMRKRAMDNGLKILYDEDVDEI